MTDDTTDEADRPALPITLALPDETDETDEEEDDYPAGLRRAGRALATVLCDPANATLTIKDICQKAGVCDKSYRYYLARPEYAAYLRRLRARSLQHRLAGILEARANVALSPSRDGYNDARLILELLGDLPDPRAAQQTAQRSGLQPAVDLAVVVASMTPEQLALCSSLAAAATAASSSSGSPPPAVPEAYIEGEIVQRAGGEGEGA